MAPPLVSIRTAVSPGPADSVRRTGTLSRSASHMASSSQLGFSDSPSTVADSTSTGFWSSAAASIERHGVMRVQDRSVSPGLYDLARAASSALGASAE